MIENLKVPCRVSNQVRAKRKHMHTKLLEREREKGKAKKQNPLSC
jgi:hypothetical protein